LSNKCAGTQADNGLFVTEIGAKKHSVSFHLPVELQVCYTIFSAVTLFLPLSVNHMRSGPISFPLTPPASGSLGQAE
jgi:hypothetical protein